MLSRIRDIYVGVIAWIEGFSDGKTVELVGGRFWGGGVNRVFFYFDVVNKYIVFNKAG